MASKFVVLALFVAVAHGSGISSSSWSYGVSDPYTGDVKSQQENRVGDSVVGQYSLLESDGTRRTVDYAADAHSGFNAVVRKDPAVIAAPAVVPAPVVAAAPAVIAARTVAAAPAVYATPAVAAAPAVVAAPAASWGYAARAAPVAYGAAAPAVVAAPAASWGYAARAAPVAYGAAAAPLAYNSWAAAPVAAGVVAAPLAGAIGYGAHGW